MFYVYAVGISCCKYVEGCWLFRSIDNAVDFGVTMYYVVLLKSFSGCLVDNTNILNTL